MPIRQALAPDKLAKIAIVIWALLIYGAGHHPASGHLFHPPWDKAAHLIAYTALGLLLGLSYPKLSWYKIALITTMFGGLDELHQLFVSGRQPGLDDLIFDVMGGLLACALLKSGKP